MSTAVSADLRLAAADPDAAEVAAGPDDDGFDPFEARRRSTWREVVPRVGAWLGAFGLAAVVLGAMTTSAMQRTAAAYPEPAAFAGQAVASDDPVTDEPLAAPADPAAPRAARAVQPIQRVDQAWAARNAAATGIPVRAFLAYASASLTVAREQPGCGIGWNTLAGIGSVESAHATHGGARLLGSGLTKPAILGPALNGNGVGTIRDSDNGVWDGDRAWDHAVGPMQFIPSTWRRWGADGNGDGRANPNQIDDAALTAARYLCASGPMTTGAAWRAAILTYNHSDAYVNSVANAANHYAAAARP